LYHKSDIPPPSQTTSASEASDDDNNEYAPGHMPVPDFEALAWDIQNRASRHVDTPPAGRPRHRGGRNGGAGTMGPSPNEMCTGGRAAFAVLDREGVIATCQSMTTPWAIERAERARQQQGEGGDRRWGGGQGRVGGDAIIGSVGSF